MLSLLGHEVSRSVSTLRLGGLTGIGPSTTEARSRLLKRSWHRDRSKASPLILKKKDEDREGWWVRKCQ